MHFKIHDQFQCGWISKGQAGGGERKGFKEQKQKCGETHTVLCEQTMKHALRVK